MAPTPKPSPGASARGTAPPVPRSSRPSGSKSTVELVTSLVTGLFSDPVGTVRALLFDRAYFWILAAGLLAFQFAIGLVIIWKIPYTKIDWDAYMQQVDGFLTGERDYSKLEGETGPLVYPALHLYIYTALYKLLPAAGRERPAQFIFLVVESVTLVLVSTIYFLAGRSKHIPQWILIPLVFSKRSHSIYLLRLFNDPFAMLIFYASVVLFQTGWWKVASLVYSLALGVKMNILLTLPGLLVILFQNRGAFGTVDSVVLIAITQVALPGFYFLDTAADARAYFTSAFDFSREFMYKWTVNWRFVSEETFLSKGFARGLLIAHVVTLIAFGWFRWNPVPGGSAAVLKRGLSSVKASFRPAVPLGQLPSSHIPLVLFTSNLIGMTFARSLHYQFHAWYFHQLPLLLYLGGGWGEPVLILGFIALLEKAWLTYPSTPRSSLAMLAVHLVILAGLWFKGPRPPVVAPLAKRK
ncbi:Dol-P-Man:Man(5)GlcNAc(2)-PP-Dol alpha-1,3-mannosyltransferase [Vanrija pseudolonga]|uniref:Dol-P-Man:Man(5)GlcNAc(2)-PP-Dol alpha-1,3-mannosyltransferase n=1 Tax=Vanrija pseudolonga TaxID=143232 RepID=A0AAF0Y824_9TREE|nr:Dol-P-Man:Man(5)GlcNAc(2)-PP-Dol alpha-1,3-mannosyltransferase [Vanrija pseudolonga]